MSNSIQSIIIDNCHILLKIISNRINYARYYYDYSDQLNSKNSFDYSFINVNNINLQLR